MHKLRSLHLVYTLPCPARSGYDLRVLNLMNNLAPHMDQTMFCRTMEPLTAEQRNFCKTAPFTVQTLHLPRPTLPQKIRKGLRFLCSPYPIISGGWYFPEMAGALRTTLQNNDFDFVVMEGIWMCVYWPIIAATGVPVVLDLFDLEAQALVRQADQLPHGLQRMLYRHSAKRMAKLESLLPGQSAITWVVSEKERQMLLQQHPQWPIFLAPNGVDGTNIKQLLPARDQKTILFVGSLQYMPNIDGVNYFVKNVMPKILEQLPDAIFHVVGHHPDERVLALHHPPSIHIKGDVPTLSPCYEACNVCVVPLRSGGGTRLKILEAMAYGRPVVSTSIGAEGLDVTHMKNILIADTTDDMAHAIALLLMHPDLTRKLVKNGRELIDSQYHWKQIADGMFARYAHQAAIR